MIFGIAFCVVASLSTTAYAQHADRGLDTFRAALARMAQVPALVPADGAEGDGTNAADSSDAAESNDAVESNDGPLRIMVYGASHTASDAFTSVMRRKLQGRYGDGGPGWVLPAVPFPFYEHRGYAISGHGWQGLKVRYREREPGPYGMAGMALDSQERAWGELELAHPVRDGRITFSWLQQPGGGAFVLEGAGTPQRIATAGSSRTRFRTFEGPTIEHITVRARGRTRLFGVAVERRTGVVVDAFGVPGARAVDQLPWATRSLRTSLQARPPALIVLAYGTNESAVRGQAGDEQRLGQVVRRLRRAAPNAACLLVGPGEWPRRRGEGLRARPRTGQVIAQQRRVAARFGCAYFDTFAWMGGEGTMARWLPLGLAHPDLVHFTDHGYALLGMALTAFLVGQESAVVVP